MEHGAPLLLGLELAEELDVPETTGIGAVVGPACLGDDLEHFGERCEDDARLVVEALRLGEAGAGRQGAAGPDGAFVEVGKKLRTDDPAEEQEGREPRGHHAEPQDDAVMPDGPAELPAIELGHVGHDGVVPFVDPLAEEPARDHRRDHDREGESADQRERHRPGHRLEQAPLDALQGEDRDVGRDDDGDGEEHRTLDLLRGAADRLRHGLLGVGVLAATNPADDVLDHDHGAIDHHSEVERAEREQVGRDLGQVQEDGGDQQRERNRERHRERGAHVAEEEQQQDGHQDHPLGQVVQNRVRRVAQQVRPVEHVDDLHAGRQDLLVELLDLVVQAHQRRRGVGALAQVDDGVDDVGVVDDLSVGTMDGLADLAQADLLSLRDLRDVLDPQRRPGLRLEEGVLDVLDRRHEADRPNVHLLQALFDEAAARVDVVGPQLLLDLTDRHAVRDELVRVDADLILAGGSPEGARVDDARNRLERLGERPVLDRLELHDVDLGIGAPERVPIDLPDRAPVGAHRWRESVRQIDPRQAFEHPLAVPVVLGGVVEDHDDE